MGLADDRKPVNLMTVHVSKSVTVHEVSNIFITNAIRIEVMPECPPEFFRVLIQGLKDHA